MTNSKDLTVVISNLNEVKILIFYPKNFTNWCFSFIYGDLANGEYVAYAMGVLEGAGVAKAAYVYPVLKGWLDSDYEVPLDGSIHPSNILKSPVFFTDFLIG